jgi:hypothetical protein
MLLTLYKKGSQVCAFSVLTQRSHDREGGKEISETLAQEGWGDVLSHEP